MEGILIHLHTYKSGGIGDFIRASMSFYSLCKRLGFKYYISFEDNQFMNECFEIIKIPDDVNLRNFKKLQLLAGTCDFEYIKPVLQILNDGKVCKLVCNLIGFETNENIMRIREEYINEVLKPSSKVNFLISNTLERYNLKDNSYISIHIRCGDKNMSLNDLIDSRLDLENIETFNQYINLIKEFKEKYGNNLPIVLHSDSFKFKSKIKELINDIITLDLEIKHIAEDIGNNTSDAYLSTISEFYIVSKAYKIYMPNIYSGFSHIASIIGNKPLYTKINECRFYMLNTDNIYII